MMRRYFLLVAMLVVISAGLKGQQATRGDVNIIQDSRVEELLEKHRQINEAFNGLSGYRIQIFFDSGSNAKNRANNERRRFMALFPSISAYILFDAPNFKVRVGNFRSRLEAEKFLNDILKHFEMAYVVPSRIELPKL
ncbi:MAG TPA: SPOR domain-containing protein [Bacteroidales bacterium]|nr:SPOR domain-containing protein [Bacteroidales bacterium]HRZ49799.1 SPOR domain-containing protein [Bacteroidales bacterium]